MKRMILLVAVAGFVCRISSAAFGEIIRVPIEYSTIQSGVDAAFSNDMVQVASGTSYENITLKIGVKIQGAGELSLGVTVPNDFNGNGTADVLLRNNENGSWHLFLMNGPDIKPYSRIDLPTDLNLELYPEGSCGDGITNNGRNAMMALKARHVMLIVPGVYVVTV